MLTKYLAEAGERTPLTAVVCIDNPFDLEEITRTSPYCTSLDQQLTAGLFEILRENKELFQGRTKTFDVGKALSSKSVREFDKALSMVTYGCESVEDFYSRCVTRDVIGQVKVPVLFIQVQEFLKAFVGGIAVVLLIQFVNTILGAAIFSRPPYLPHPFDAMEWLKGCARLLLLIVRGCIAATFVVVVEELLVRSWMPIEISIDLGCHQSNIITGLVFALFQRSPRAIPGLWLLSLALTGTRERSQGNLIIPIAFRTRIIATSFVLQSGGLLTYNLSSPVWIAGTRPLQPFSGVVGLAVSLALALILYPRHSSETRCRNIIRKANNNKKRYPL